MMRASKSLIAAVEALWRIPRPGPDRLFSDPSFISLRALCEAEYGDQLASTTLSTSLRSLGLPSQLPAHLAGLSMEPLSAANAIAHAYTCNTILRRHLCPLDLADDLPPLDFGNARVAKFSPSELAELFNAPRLDRNFHSQPFEAERLAQFHWLVVDEEVAIDPTPGARTSWFNGITFEWNKGEVDPHPRSQPPVVDAALFFLLLAPWETWAGMPDIDWRGFNIPWVYTLDDDLFVRPSPPPSSHSLSWEPEIFQNRAGEQIEAERPTTLYLNVDAPSGLSQFTDNAWRNLNVARASELFSTPLEHFIVRAFFSDGIDEIMAHMSAIEAALGLEADYKRSLRPKRETREKAQSATNRVSARLAAVLNDGSSVAAYKELFELRSAFVHGRADIKKISAIQRVKARELARGVAHGLVDIALKDQRTRDEILNDLLDQGFRYL